MPELLAAEIGNSRLALGRLEGRKVIDAARLGASEIAPAIEQLAAWRSESADAPLLIASVDDEAAARLTAAARDQLRIDVYRVGEDLPVPDVLRQLHQEVSALSVEGLALLLADSVLVELDQESSVDPLEGEDCILAEELDHELQVLALADRVHDHDPRLLEVLLPHRLLQGSPQLLLDLQNAVPEVDVSSP